MTEEQKNATGEQRDTSTTIFVDELVTFPSTLFPVAGSSCVVAVPLFVSCRLGSSRFNLDNSLVVDMFAHSVYRVIPIGFCHFGYRGDIGYADYNRHIQLPSTNQFERAAGVAANGIIEGIYTYEHIEMDGRIHSFRTVGLGSFMTALSYQILRRLGVVTIEHMSGTKDGSDRMLSRFGITIPPYSFELEAVCSSSYAEQCLRDFICVR